MRNERHEAIFETIRSIKNEQDVLLRRSYGMIEVVRGEVVRIQLRPWPKFGSLLESRWIQTTKNKRYQRDVCRLFYNQPMRHRNFLTLSYVESSLNTSVRTFYAALDALNQIAYIKRSDALIAEVTNDRISDRFMFRRGWERFLENDKRRNWIKRFYGEYPEKAVRFFDFQMQTAKEQLAAK